VPLPSNDSPPPASRSNLRAILRVLGWSAFVLGGVSGFAQTPPSGGLRADSPADFAPHPASGKTFNELWTYQFWLNGGIQVQLNLSRANFGSFKDPVCGADLAVTSFRGKNAFVAREYPVKRFSWSPANARLEVHPNIYTEGFPPRAHKVYFSTVKEGVAYFLELTFEGMTPGAVWGDGIFDLADGQKMGLYFHIPKARVTGRMGINGDTLAVKGFGWMDHTWQTQFAPKLIDVSYRYAVFSGRAEGGYFFQKGDAVFGYGVREEKGRLSLLNPNGIKVPSRTNWGGTSLARQLEVSLANGTPIHLVRTEDRQRTSFMQELSTLERFGAKVFLGGELVGFRGIGTVDGSLPAIYSFTVVKR
jgi:hypothetical protein